MSSHWRINMEQSEELVYDHSGQVIGAIFFNPYTKVWDGHGQGPLLGPFRSRVEASNAVFRYTRAQAATSRPQALPQGYAGPQPGNMDVGEVVGEVLAGVALVGALSSLFADEQPGHSQQSDLERQNELLRQQNELLKQALAGRGSVQGSITKR